MPDVRQFVVQRHDTGGAVHWDFMLEQDDALTTWQLPVPPEQIGAQPVTAQRIFDHPKRFLTYEGPLRNHPGSVRIHDRGTYVALEQSENIWCLSIASPQLRGIYILTRRGASPQDDPRETWHMVRTQPG